MSRLAIVSGTTLAAFAMTACGDDNQDGSTDGASNGGGAAQGLSETEQVVATFLERVRLSDRTACDLVTENYAIESLPITESDPGHPDCLYVRTSIIDATAANEEAVIEGREGANGEALVDLSAGLGYYSFVLVEDGDSWKIDEQIVYQSDPQDPANAEE